MRALVDEALNVLIGTGPLVEFGRLLHESWMLKRSLSSQVAPGFVDDIYARARAAGATGGKLLGAGGGGFILLLVEPERRAQVLASLGDLLVIPINLDRFGSQVVFFDTDPMRGSYSNIPPIPARRWA
jgi:D-glycero-alpha-D-manno-heptose-7-phosphate kinase